MPEAAIGVRTVLLDRNFSRQKRHRDLTTLSVRWDKGGDVAFDRCFAHGVAHVRALGQSHIDAVELDF